MENKKLTVRQWLSFILVGFVGQLAWAVENNEINPWVYSQTKDALWITLMTVFSAIAATLTTLVMGTVSDRLGKRKLFISGGYIIWGVTVFAFGLISWDNMAAIFGPTKAATMVGVFMVVMDCIMTFFGSTSNDACFNAYVTDTTSEGNRGKVESVLSVLPLIANIAMAAGLMVFGASSTASGAATVQENAEATAKPWLYFFLAFGALVVLIGVVSIFLLPKDETRPNKESSFWKSLIYGFRPSVIKQHKTLYIALLAFMAFNTAINAFMPYWTVYFQNPTSLYGLGFYGDKFMLYLISLVSILLVSSIAVVIIGLFMDKIGKLKLLLPGIGLACLGFIGMFFSTQVWSLILSGILMMSGYLIGTAVLGAVVRDETPKEQVGLFQGVRMIFAVLIAMIVGSYTSLAFFALSGKTYTDASTGVSSAAPTNVMFLVSLGFMLIAIAPSLWLIHIKKKGSKEPEISANPTSK